jgi:hypothetical protein
MFIYTEHLEGIVSDILVKSKAGQVTLYLKMKSHVFK